MMSGENRILRIMVERMRRGGNVVGKWQEQLDEYMREVEINWDTMNRKSESEIKALV